MSIDILVVIVSFNTRELLRKCLLSVLRSAGDISTRVVVVDNASQDGSCEMLKKEFPEVCLIENKDNVGFARAVNQGVKRFRADFILLVNPDVEIKEEAVAAMYRFIKEREEIGIVGCKLLFPDGRRQHSCRRFPTLTVSIFEVFPVNLLFPHNKWVKHYNYNFEDFKEPVEVEWISGAVLLIRYKVFEELKGFDEEFFIYSEEMDFFKRLRDRGYKAYYYPKAEAIHHHGASTQQTYARQVDFYKSLHRFFKKHYGTTKASLLKAFIALWSILYAGFLLSRWIIFRRDKDREKAKALASLFKWSVGVNL